MTTGELTTGPSDFGTLIVDGEGRTVYLYDQDTPNSGASSCYDVCAANWPPVVPKSGTPEAVGITAKVGTITREGGGKQVTVNGWPVYYYGNDTQIGDVKGQGADGVWWALSPAGKKLG